MNFRLVESLEKATPYMLRNDGKLLRCGAIHPYIKYWYYGSARFDHYLFDSLVWVYKNTRKESTKKLAKIVLKYGVNLNTNLFGSIEDVEKQGIDLTDTYVAKEGEIDGFIDSLNDDMNQEFCRVRTSGLLYGGNSKDIYFRISSIGFNWFPLIWEVVYKNKPSKITVVKDDATFGGENELYRVDGKKIEQMPYREFIMLGGNPVIEKLKSDIGFVNNSQDGFRSGKSMTEIFNWTHPVHAHRMYEKQVEEQLEFDIHHLLHK